MSETSIPQGEIVTGKMVHRAAMNCLIVNYARPEDWFFKQFFSTDEIEQYAAEYNLIIKQENPT